MNILKITDRQEVLERVLREAFKPKFDAIFEEIKVLLIGHLNKEHPVFMEMLAVKERRQYMYLTYIDRFYINDSNVRYPEYGQYSEILMYGSNNRKMVLKDIQVPMNMNSFEIVNDNMFKWYSETWRAYSEAHKELFALLSSYKSRDKFEKDFPEYKEYLPVLEVKKQLPQVIASEVRGRLSSLGIPAK